eukprot:TRINITY_DN838_c0_g1_i6.p1 TRINITY_DN838_c0_g1~~TRINITY_DN838_c0_g1_i6.p1  ORF type:complete len:446 (+),score=112.80 TRINITY_DN838_c0_g1_i6:110-1447(+)
MPDYTTGAPTNYPTPGYPAVTPPGYPASGGVPPPPSMLGIAALQMPLGGGVPPPVAPPPASLTASAELPEGLPAPAVGLSDLANSALPPADFSKKPTIEIVEAPAGAEFFTSSASPDSFIGECRDFVKGLCERGNQCRFKHNGRPASEWEQGFIDQKGDIIEGAALPPRGVFAPPPKEAKIEDNDEKEVEPLGTQPSAILGLSETDIAQMSADELVIHLEKKIIENQNREEVGVGYDDLPPLPPLPPPAADTFINGNITKVIYDGITALSKELQETSEEDVLAEVQDLDDDTATAFARVLIESGYGRLGGQKLPFPEVQSPDLPPGHASWIVYETNEQKSARLLAEHHRRNEAKTIKTQREQEYQRKLKAKRENLLFQKRKEITMELLKADDQHPAADVKEAMIHLNTINDQDQMHSLMYEVRADNLDSGMKILIDVFATVLQGR